MDNCKIKKITFQGDIEIFVKKINELIDEINEMKEFINNEKLK